LGKQKKVGKGKETPQLAALQTGYGVEKKKAENTSLDKVE